MDEERQLAEVCFPEESEQPEIGDIHHKQAGDESDHKFTAKRLIDDLLGEMPNQKANFRDPDVQED